jgi:hypothetical protein
MYMQSPEQVYDPVLTESLGSSSSPESLDGWSSPDSLGGWPLPESLDPSSTAIHVH